MKDSTSAQLQIRFLTKQERFSVADNPFAVPSTVTTTDLNEILNNLLREGNENLSDVEFDFIAGGELLRSSLGEHLTKLGISLESVVVVEYLERLPPPDVLDCLVHDDWVSSVDVCDKAIITGCYDNKVHLYTIEGDLKSSLEGHESAIKAVAWLKGEGDTLKFVSGSLDQNCMVWEWNYSENTVECRDVCRGHVKAVESLAVSPSSSRFASGSWDKFLKIWKVDYEGESEQKKSRPANKTRSPLVTLKGHRDVVSGIDWLDEVELVTCSHDHTIRLWDTEMNSSVREIGGNKSFFDVKYSHLKKLLATASSDRNVRLYDPRSNEGQLVKITLTSHSLWVSSLSWSTTKENLLISGSYDNAVKAWDIRSPQVPLYDLMAHDDKVLCTNWSKPSLIVSGGADNTLRVFESKF